MGRASFYRIGAMATIAGTILALVFNVVHGRASDATSTEAQLRLAADKGPWVLIHLGLVVGVLLITGGMLAVSRSLEGEPGSAWARTSWPRSGSSPWGCSSGAGPTSFRPDREGGEVPR